MQEQTEYCRCLALPPIQIRINPRIKLIPYITRMRSRIRASHAPHTTRARALNPHTTRGIRAVIHIAIHPRIQLIRKITRMVSSIPRSSHAPRIRAVIHIAIDPRVHLIAHISRVWASVRRSRSRAAVIHIRIEAGIDLVPRIRRVRAVVCGYGCGVLVLGRCAGGGHVVAYAMGGLSSHGYGCTISHVLIILQITNYDGK